MPNGIDLILADHRAVEALSPAFDRDAGRRRHRPGRRHAHRPRRRRARGALPPRAHLLGDAAFDRVAGRGTLAVKKQIDYLKALEGPPLVAAFEALRLLVPDHVEDEEKNLLPALADKATPQQLDTLGARILQAKQRGG